MGFQDDVIYGCLLLFSVPFGHIVKKIDCPVKKQYVSTAVGVTLIILVCRHDGLHSVVTVLGNIAIISLFSPRICHWISFGWCFGYIVFFRLTHYLGLPKVLPHANAVQLLLTLKLVGLAFEIHDTYVNREAAKKNPKDEKIKLQNEYQNVSPSCVEQLHYSFCYIGLLTVPLNFVLNAAGPYYKYRTYHDMMHTKNIRNIDTLTPTMRRLKRLPLYAVAFFIGSMYFNIDYARSDAFYTEPFWFRLFYMAPMFFMFRMRLYLAWLMSEAMCIMAGLGAYPAASKPRVGVGPSNLTALKECESQSPEGVAYDFETVHNVYEYGCELSTTVREGMKAWNMTVQYWLAFNVYRRITLKSGPIRVAITMSVSAFWHGVHPGYYIAFLTVPPILMAEDFMAAAFRDSKNPNQQIIYDWVAWFWRCRAFDYMCMGFLLLSYHDTMRYYTSIYFFTHVFMFVFIAIGYLFKPRKIRTGLTDSSKPTSVDNGKSLKTD